MFDGNWRSGVAKVSDPIGRGLVRLHVTPDVLTGLGLVMAATAGILCAQGHIIVALCFGTAACLPDALDGAVAKASNTASKRGAYFDSVADRVTDTFMFMGVAWYLTDRDGGHVGLLPVAVLAAGYLISYQRAKAESLGYYAKGGLMERAERLILLGIGLAFAAQLLVPIMWVMFVLCVITALGRFIQVWRQAEPPPRFEYEYPEGSWRAKRYEVALERRAKRQEMSEVRRDRRREREAKRRAARHEFTAKFRMLSSAERPQSMTSRKRKSDGS